MGWRGEKLTPMRRRPGRKARWMWWLTYRSQRRGGVTQGSRMTLPGEP